MELEVSLDMSVALVEDAYLLVSVDEVGRFGRLIDLLSGSKLLTGSSTTDSLSISSIGGVGSEAGESGVDSSGFFQIPPR